MKNHQRNFWTAITVIVSLILSTLPSPAGYIVPINGLIGYWPGNGSGIDVSPTGNNASFGGSYAPGPPPGGLAFNVGSAKAVMGNIAAYNFKSYPGWSVGFWFNGNGSAISGNNGLFLGQDNASGYNPKWFIDYGYSVYGDGPYYYLHLNDYNQERIFLNSSSEPAPTGWNQLTVTVNNTNNGAVAFYLNGQPIGTGSLGNYVLETTAPLVFGQAEGLSYSGLISDVVIYNRVLSAAEASQLATVSTNAPFAITSERLDGHGNVALTWQSVPGRVYQVISATNLAKPVRWANVGNPILAVGTNTSATIPASLPMNFYSVATPN